MHKNSYKSRLYELISASQGAKAVVGAFKKVGRQYDKPHLVSWWVGLYSRRGLPLRGRGAYGPVLTHGPRVVAADAAGAEALVGVLKIIKDASYNKTREPPWRAREKRHPPLVDCATTFPPAEAGGLWTLAVVPQDSVEERRAVYSVPRMGWQGNTSHTSEHILKERSDAQNIVSR